MHATSEAASGANDRAGATVTRCVASWVIFGLVRKGPALPPITDAFNQLGASLGILV